MFCFLILFLETSSGTWISIRKLPTGVSHHFLVSNFPSSFPKINSNNCQFIEFKFLVNSILASPYCSGVGLDGHGVGPNFNFFINHILLNCNFWEFRAMIYQKLLCVPHCKNIHNASCVPHCQNIHIQSVAFLDIWIPCTLIFQVVC